MISSLLLLGRALLLMASFSGLCAALRIRLGIDRFVAPFTTASCIILFLVVAGILNLLEAGTYFLYLLGFCGLAYALVSKRASSHAKTWMPLILSLFAAFLTWRFYSCRLRHIDDFSHWGTIVNFLLQRDRFPVGNDNILSHQSYPPGSACFIYYVARAIAAGDVTYLVAQNFLVGIAFFPVFALIQRRNRRTFYPLVAALFLAFFCYSCRNSDLLVDELQCFYGIGIAAAIALYRDHLKLATISVLPAMIAVALFKNSGLFFSLTGAMMLAYAARRNVYSGAALHVRELAYAGSPILAYFIWSIHVRLRFPSAELSSHAVSLTAYAENFHSKGLSGIATVFKSMVLSFFSIGSWRIAMVILLISALLILRIASRKFASADKRCIRRTVLFSFAMYGVWLLLIFAMYVVSMTGEIALEASSFSRYNGTGFAYVTGIICILLLFVLQREESCFSPKFMRTASNAALVGMAGILALMFWPGMQTPIDAFLLRPSDYREVRRLLVSMCESYDLSYGGHYLYIIEANPESEPDTLPSFYNTIRYEFGDGNPCVLSTDGDIPNSFLITDYGYRATAADLQACLAENIAHCDALLLVGKSSEFEEQLSAILEIDDGSTPIYRAHSIPEEASV